jgi:hypothetical protein
MNCYPTLCRDILSFRVAQRDSARLTPGDGVYCVSASIRRFFKREKRETQLGSKLAWLSTITDLHQLEMESKPVEFRRLPLLKILNIYPHTRL